MPVTTRSQGPATHGLYTPPPSSLFGQRRSRPATAANAPRRPAKPHHSRAGQDSFGVFWSGDWLETNKEMWGEIIAGEEMGRKKKQRACLGGRKGKVVEGGRKRDPAGSGKFWCPPAPKQVVNE